MTKQIVALVMAVTLLCGTYISSMQSIFLAETFNEFATADNTAWDNEFMYVMYCEMRDSTVYLEDIQYNTGFDEYHFIFTNGVEYSVPKQAFHTDVIKYFEIRKQQHEQYIQETT